MNTKNSSGYLYGNLHSLLRTIGAILVACIVGSSLFLFAACSSQNTIVNPPPPAGTWRIVRSQNPGIAQNSFNAIAAISASDAWAVGSYSNQHLGMQGAKALIEHWNGTAWKMFASPNPGSGFNVLNGITAVSADDVWTAGEFSNGNTGGATGQEQARTMGHLSLSQLPQVLAQQARRQ